MSEFFHKVLSYKTNDGSLYNGKVIADLLVCLFFLGWAAWEVAGASMAESNFLVALLLLYPYLLPVVYLLGMRRGWDRTIRFSLMAVFCGWWFWSSLPAFYPGWRPTRTCVQALPEDVLPHKERCPDRCYTYRISVGVSA